MFELGCENASGLKLEALARRELGRAESQGMSDALAVVRRTRGIASMYQAKLPGALDPTAPEHMTKDEAIAYIQRFARAELANSLRALVELRDFSPKESVRLGATSELVRYAIELRDTSDTGGDAPLRELGVSSEQLVEFLKARKGSATPR